MKNKNNTNTKTLFAKNARPKNIVATFRRNAGGKYHVVCAEYLDTINQYAGDWVGLDARAFASELKRAAMEDDALTVD